MAKAATTPPTSPHDTWGVLAEDHAKLAGAKHLRTTHLFGASVGKVLPHVHPGKELTRAAASTMDDLLASVLMRVVETAARAITAKNAVTNICDSMTAYSAKQGFAKQMHTYSVVVRWCIGRCRRLAEEAVACCGSYRRRRGPACRPLCGGQGGAFREGGAVQRRECVEDADQFQEEKASRRRAEWHVQQRRLLERDRQDEASSSGKAESCRGAAARRAWRARAGEGRGVGGGGGGEGSIVIYREAEAAQWWASSNRACVVVRPQKSVGGFASDWAATGRARQAR